MASAVSGSQVCDSFGGDPNDKLLEGEHVRNEMVSKLCRLSCPREPLPFSRNARIAHTEGLGNSAFSFFLVECGGGRFGFAKPS